MKTKNHTFKPRISVLVAVTILFMVTLGCAVNTGHRERELGLEQTEVVLKLTQMALERQSTQIATPVMTAEEAQSATPPGVTTDATSTPEPTHAPSITYEGISFNFDQGIADGIIPSTIPEQIMDEEYPMPEMTYPIHTQFDFEGYQVSQHFHTPIIRVYPVQAYVAVNDSVSNSIASLRLALNNCPTGGLFSTLPFLPPWNAAQVVSVQVVCFDFQNGSGLRYLTMWGQGVSPIDNQNLFYTYQGITHDGAFYISAILPITHPELPDDGFANVTDWDAFYENWEADITAAILMLDQQPLSSFSPNITFLDEMMASFRIER